jgi:superkiller protein 3
MVIVQSHLENGFGLLCSGRFQEALEPLRSALARDPQNKEARQMMGIAYSGLGRYPQAIEEFVRCLELPPHANDRIPRFELASAYIRAQRPDDAERELRKILAIDPQDAPSWHNLGVAHAMRGNIASAKEAWRKSLEADPGYELARQALARVGS